MQPTIDAATAIVLHIIVWTIVPFLLVIALVAIVAHEADKLLLTLVERPLLFLEACLRVADRRWARARGRA